MKNADKPKNESEWAAWDAYFSALATRYYDPDPPALAERADAMLAERRKRYPSQ